MTKNMPILEKDVTLNKADFRRVLDGWFLSPSIINPRKVFLRADEEIQLLSGCWLKISRTIIPVLGGCQNSRVTFGGKVSGNASTMETDVMVGYLKYWSHICCD